MVNFEKLYLNNSLCLGLFPLYHFRKPYIYVKSFVLFQANFHFGKPYMNDALPFFQATFHFGKSFVTLSFCSGHFPLRKTVCDACLFLGHLPLWKTTCVALPCGQATYHFGKPYVTLCPLFRPLSTLETHMRRFALCSGHFPLWKTVCDFW